MRKTILSIIVAFIFISANAQKINFGLKGGVNLSVFTGDIVEKVDARVGFQAGGFSVIELSDKFFLQPEVLFTSGGVKLKGFTFNYGGENYIVDGKVKLGYIQIPVLLKYYVYKRITILAGPQVGLLTTAKSEALLNGEKSEEDVKDNFKDFDFGLNVGAGFDINKNSAIEVRYNVGLSNIAKPVADEDANIHNSILSLSLDYTF